MNVLAGLPGATVATNVLDTEGRTATCITYRNEHARPGMTQLIYFDSDYQFISYTYTVENTDERGEHIITERRHHPRRGAFRAGRPTRGEATVEMP